jgi:uncharacterized membrane protein
MTSKIEKSIDVEVPVRAAYNQWTQFEEFPLHGGVEQVQQIDQQRLRWPTSAEDAGRRRDRRADPRQADRLAQLAGDGTPAS